MRASVVFSLVGGTVFVGVSGTSLLVLRAMIADRAVLGSWEDLILLPFLALGAWLTIHAIYGAEMNGRVNDKNRRLRALKAALKESLTAGATSPNEARAILSAEEDGVLDRCATVIDLDLRRPGHKVPPPLRSRHAAPDLRDFTHPDFMTPDEERAADAELGGLKPPSDSDKDA